MSEAWRIANPEKSKEGNRLASARYRAKYPDRIRASTLAWRTANPEKIKESNRVALRLWKEKNPDRVIKYRARAKAKKAWKAWRKNNPERAKASARASMARWRKKHPDIAKERDAKKYRKHREEILKRVKQRREENIEMARKRDREWNKRNPEKVRDHRIRGQYGISAKEYDAIIDRAGTLCPICGKSFGEIPPCLDHNHSTGKIRGVICGLCNSGLGFFRDNLDILLNAVEYLRREGEVVRG